MNIKINFLSVFSFLFIISCEQVKNKEGNEKSQNTLQNKKGSSDDSLITKKKSEDLIDGININVSSLDDFIRNLSNPFVNFVYYEPKKIDNNIYFPNEFQGGLYVISYTTINRKKDKSIHGVKDIMKLGRVLVGRPYSTENWLQGDPSEILLAFEVFHSDVEFENLIPVGSRKIDVIEKYGDPDVINDSVITYLQINKTYSVNLDFHISSDTVSKIVFKKLKK